MNKSHISNKKFRLKAVAIVVLQGFLVSNIVPYDISSELLSSKSHMRIESIATSHSNQQEGSVVEEGFFKTPKIKSGFFAKRVLPLIFLLLIFLYPNFLSAETAKKDISQAPSLYSEQIDTGYTRGYPVLYHSDDSNSFGLYTEITRSSDALQALYVYNKEGYLSALERFAKEGIIENKRKITKERYKIIKDYKPVLWGWMKADGQEYEYYSKYSWYNVRIKGKDGRSEDLKGVPGIGVVVLRALEMEGKLEIVDVKGAEGAKYVVKSLSYHFTDADVSTQLILMLAAISSLCVPFVIVGGTDGSALGAYESDKRSRKKRISDDISSRVLGRAMKVINEKDKENDKNSKSYNIRKRPKDYSISDKFDKDKDDLFFYNQYREYGRQNPLLWLLPAYFTKFSVAKALFRRYIVSEYLPMGKSIFGGNETVAGSSGASSSTDSSDFHRSPSSSPADSYLYLLIQSAKATVQENRSPRLLKECNPKANLDKKLEELPVSINLSDTEKAELRGLIRGYFKLERFVHRIKKEYVSEGRVNLLAISDWTIFSNSLLKDTLTPLMYSDSSISEEKDIDFMTMYGEGTGMETPIDELFGSSEFVSFTMEDFEKLDGVFGTGFEDTGIAIVFHPEALEKTAPMMAVDVPDEVYLSTIYAQISMTKEIEEQLKQEVLTVDGIRDLREEMIVRQGMNEVSLNGLLPYQQGPFSPREVMKADGVIATEDNLEAIVAADELFELVKSKAGSKAHKVVRASEYFKKTLKREFKNERLNEAQRIKKEIFEIIRNAEKRAKRTGKITRAEVDVSI